MSESRNRGVIGILLMVFIFFIILMIFAFYTVSAFKKSNFDNQFTSSTGKESIAVVELNGAINTSKDTIEKLHQADKEKSFLEGSIKLFWFLVFFGSTITSLYSMYVVIDAV